MININIDQFIKNRTDMNSYIYCYRTEGSRYDYLVFIYRSHSKFQYYRTQNATQKINGFV